MALLDATSAELAKLRTLPAAVFATVGTILAGAAITAALVAEQNTPEAATNAVIQAVPFVQAGIILLSVLPATHEHAGTQFRTSLAVVPNRVLLVTGKSVATLLTVAFTAVLTVGASLVAAVTTRLLLDAPAAAETAEPRVLAGATIYLTLIGLLTHSAALLVRHMTPALVTMLTLVLIVSPLVASASEHARWLPDRAGSLLYAPSADVALTAGTGALVLLGWIILTGMAAVTSFLIRDV